jgi:hypothetical protein
MFYIILHLKNRRIIFFCRKFKAVAQVGKTAAVKNIFRIHCTVRVLAPMHFHDVLSESFEILHALTLHTASILKAFPVVQKQKEITRVLRRIMSLRFLGFRLARYFSRIFNDPCLTRFIR